VDADPFIALPQHPTLDVDVVVNGRQVAEWSYSAPFVAPVRQARIPVGVFANRPGLDVELRIRNPESPLSLGVGVTPSALGPRFLGLNVRSLVVRRAVDTSPRESGTTPTGGSRR
jgi:hypothetical protein